MTVRPQNNNDLEALMQDKKPTEEMGVFTPRSSLRIPTLDSFPENAMDVDAPFNIDDTAMTPRTSLSLIDIRTRSRNVVTNPT